MAAEKEPWLDNWILAFPEEFLKGEHLQGKEVTLTISKIDRPEVELLDNQTKKKKREKKTIIHFDSLKKRTDGTPHKWMAGKASCRIIADMYGQAMREWLGKRVTLFCDMRVTWLDQQTKEMRRGAIRPRPEIPPDRNQRSADDAQPAQESSSSAQSDRQQASSSPPPSSAPAAGAVSEDLADRIRSIYTGMATALKEPGALDAMAEKVEALPDCADKPILQKQIQRARRIADAQESEKR